VEESEVMQARPVYVAAVDLSCKIRYQFLSSGEFLKKSVTCNIAYYPLLFLSFIVFAAASEEFLELIKSALLAALEGMWIYTTLWTWRRILDKSYEHYCPSMPCHTISFCSRVLQPWDQAHYLGLLPSATRLGFMIFKDLYQLSKMSSFLLSQMVDYQWLSKM